MERHAHYAFVGIVATLLLLATAIFVVWLSQFQFDRQYDDYRIVFTGPVRGLSKGGDVQFNGIKVGVIQKISLDPVDTDKVIIDIQLDGGTPVRIGSIATTEIVGISGIDVVQISAGVAKTQLLRDADHRKRPIIRSKANSLSALLAGGGHVLEGANEALIRVNRLLSDRNIANLSASIGDVRSTLAVLAANRAMFANAAETMAKLDRAATDIQSTSASIRQIADGNGRTAVSNISDAASELKLAIHEARGTLATIDKQGGAVATTVIPNLNETMLSIKETSASLNGLIGDLRRDPRGTLTKPKGKEVELPK